MCGRVRRCGRKKNQGGFAQRTRRTQRREVVVGGAPPRSGSGYGESGRRPAAQREVSASLSFLPPRFCVKPARLLALRVRGVSTSLDTNGPSTSLGANGPLDFSWGGPAGGEVVLPPCWIWRRGAAADGQWRVIARPVRRLHWRCGEGVVFRRGASGRMGRRGPAQPFGRSWPGTGVAARMRAGLCSHRDEADGSHDPVLAR